MEEHQIESLRKVFVVMAKDIHVILIKIADRLHNMRTLWAMRPEKRVRIANETLEIYAPLADRLGIWEIKSELEDLCFQYLFPIQHHSLHKQMKDYIEKSEDHMNEIKRILNKNLIQNGIEAEISGRIKNIYSVYRKMVEKNKKFEQIFDIFAIRVITNNVQDCYTIMGFIHDLWKPKPGRFKDYIAIPKTNGYQSLHTTVFGPFGKLTEVQIRTKQMHEEAEYGVSAHIYYQKNQDPKLQQKTVTQEKLEWLKNLVDLQENTSDSKEFIESVKIDIFKDKIFVFTPNGEVKELPTGSTSIDFAYAIHSDIGNSCNGAKINGAIAPLSTPLNTGDVVEIISSKNSTGPKRDWLNYVKTNLAKNRIKNFFRTENAEENYEMGKVMLQKVLEQTTGITKLTNIEQVRINSLLNDISYSSFEKVLSAIGDGTLTALNVVKKLYRPDELFQDHQVKNHKQKKVKKKKSKILIQGQENMMSTIAKCCNPKEGDAIVGYITKMSGVSIHREDCKSLKKLDPKRLIHVSYDSQQESDRDFLVKLMVEGDDRTGIMRDVINVIADMKISMTGLTGIPLPKQKRFQGEITMIVKNLDQIQNVMEKLLRINGIDKVEHLSK